MFWIENNKGLHQERYDGFLGGAEAPGARININIYKFEYLLISSVHYFLQVCIVCHLFRGKKNPSPLHS